MTRTSPLLLCIRICIKVGHSGRQMLVIRFTQPQPSDASSWCPQHFNLHGCNVRRWVFGAGNFEYYSKNLWCFDLEFVERYAVRFVKLNLCLFYLPTYPRRTPCTQSLRRRKSLESKRNVIKSPTHPPKKKMPIRSHCWMVGATLNNSNTLNDITMHWPIYDGERCANA